MDKQIKTPPTERELQILTILWEKPDSTVREVLDELNQQAKRLDPQSADLAYTSVLTHLQAMERKKLVSHQSEGKAYRYRAGLKKESTLGNLAKGFLQRLFGGSLDAMIVSMVDSENVSDEELRRLERKLTQIKKNKNLSGGE